MPLVAFFGAVSRSRTSTTTWTIKCNPPFSTLRSTLRLFVARSRCLTRSDVWDAPLWLSAVELEELCAVADTRVFDAVPDLECEFMAGNKIRVPTGDDWAQAGKVLARLALAAKYRQEEIGRGRLTNDAPIAMSAGRMGIVVVTTNPKDFPKLSRVLHVSMAARRAVRNFAHRRDRAAEEAD